MTARCDVCGRFVDSDALIISAFIPPPREGMEDTIYCPRCTPTTPAAGLAAQPPVAARIGAAGVTNEGTQDQ